MKYVPFLGKIYMSGCRKKIKTHFFFKKNHGRIAMDLSIHLQHVPRKNIKILWSSITNRKQFFFSPGFFLEKCKILLGWIFFSIRLNFFSFFFQIRISVTKADHYIYVLCNSKVHSYTIIIQSEFWKTILIFDFFFALNIYIFFLG